MGSKVGCGGWQADIKGALKHKTEDHILKSQEIVEIGLPVAQATASFTLINFMTGLLDKLEIASANIFGF